MAGSLIAGLVADLEAETEDLLGVLRGLPAEAWARPTPAEGWTVHDQVAHLAHFDEVARAAVADPAGFAALSRGIGDLQTYVDAVGPANRWRDGADLVTWWSARNQAFRAAVIAADPDLRVPWFGPPMSLASKVTARIMETWAHGQDVLDALGLTRPSTDRLAHIARIGVRAMPYAFQIHGLEAPEVPVRVELAAPSGATWSWGPADAVDTIRGSALDFCLLVTRRRHLVDTTLIVAGPTARVWAEVAQAYAGPPGTGRAPGQLGGTQQAAS